MGFIARLFGVYTPAERIARAQRYLDIGEPNEARLELEGMEEPEAVAVYDKARAALVAINLEEARARFASGDDEGGKEHVAMAKEFGATDADLRESRRHAREMRAEQRRLAQEAAQAAAIIEPEGNDPLWSLPPSDPRVRFAMLVEGYPPDLRERLAALGKDFAVAVLLLEDGRAADAWKALSAFVEQEPAARYERARAALATNEFAKAASDLATFGEKVGHQRISGQHTAVMLAQLYGRTGDLDRALTVVEDQLQHDSTDLNLLATRAGLLEGKGELDQAAQLTTTVLQQAPGDLGLYRMLGRIRIRQGDRLGAMQALEAGLRIGKCETPGKCGYKPPDVASLRMLARLYLEDRLDPKRAREVVGLLSGMIQQPSWDDAYIAALAARNEDSPDTPKMVAALQQGLPPGDPRLALVNEQFQTPQLTG